MIEKDENKSELLSEFYGISEERAREILEKTNPLKFKTPTDFADNVHKICSENERKFVLAHLSVCLFETSIMLSMEKSLRDVRKEEKIERTENTDYIG